MLFVNPKAIAGKYRMTNKPAPEIASAYVASVLQPLGAFLQQHGDLVAPFAPRGQGGWDVALGEDVAGALLREVQQLLETVRKTDTTLQRRSKIKAAQGGIPSSHSRGGSNIQFLTFFSTPHIFQVP